MEDYVDPPDAADPAVGRAATALGLGLVVASVGAYAPGWQHFFESVSQMHDAMAAPGGQGLDEFWAALNFWTFFAVMHPLLTPVLWISEVLHASPGPKLGGLLPVSFVALNAAALFALGQSKALSTVVNSALVAALLGTVGQGLSSGSSNDMAGYNLNLDGETPGTVKGCPAYSEVRQGSMAGFDVDKYTGRWYENAFHDWTQFTEVYDTTLDIELAADKSKWLDDFGLKGPAPVANPKSWDKSPVANGAHYFLYGKLDPSDPNSGVLQETGFGVSFPNYIVDVKKSADGSRYEEAIQFQCLERGGVRVFEGINFLSRSPTLSPERLAAMHARATAAGMDPYGSSPDQMHVVAHTDPATWDPVANEWQTMWDAVGLPKLLALVEAATHSAFEDIEADRVQ